MALEVLWLEEPSGTGSARLLNNITCSSNLIDRHGESIRAKAKSRRTWESNMSKYVTGWHAVEEYLNLQGNNIIALAVRS